MALSPTPPQDPGADRASDAAPPAAGTPDKPFGVRAFLSNDLDPTVFDEAFLRQLERLGVLMKQPVRGGLKGGRRSVKRGQCVEFADYRPYEIGDDLRYVDWNAFGRLNRLYLKVFMDAQQAINLRLLDEFARRGITLAYPTTRSMSIPPPESSPAQG